MAIDRAQQQEEPDYEELLDELAQKIERLRVLYEQYFMGIEKMEPQTARKEVSRKLLEMTQMHIRNTGLRYRFNMLNQKFSVYVTYWNRVLREIENGTYYRDVARAGRAALRKGQDIPDEVLKSLPPRLRDKILKERERMAAAAEKKAARKAGAAGAAAPAAEETQPDSEPPRELSLDADYEDADIDDALDNLFGEAEKAVSTPAKGTPPPKPVAAPKPPPKPVAAPAPPPPKSAAPPPKPKLPPGVDEAQAREIHKRYVQAKRLLGEKTDDIKLETIVATLAKQAPAIMKQHNAKSVEFSVVIKDDKVILKATPKK